MALQFPGGCFFHIPKTGGEWVRAVLARTVDKRQLRELGHSHAAPDELQPAGIKFAIVRSPWTWLPSLYCYKRETDPEYSRMKSLRAAVAGSRTFEEFIDRYLEHSPGYVSDMYRRYTRGLDLYGKCESLREDLELILLRCGVHAGMICESLPARNQAPDRHRRQLCRYRPDQVDAIAAAERWSLDTFEYDAFP